MTADGRRQAFVYSSQGGQWPGMGRDLLDRQPLARLALEECDAVARERIGSSILAELDDSARSFRPIRDDLIQPVMTALQIALSDVLSSQERRPSAIVGLSMGELAGIYAAGVLTRETAMSVACAETIAVRGLAGAGQLTAVAAPRSRVERLLHAGGRAYVAVELSPNSTVVGGDQASMAAFHSDLARLRERFTPATMPFAFHTPEMEPLRIPFLRALPELRPTASDVPIYSSVTGGRIVPTDLDARYWWQMMSRTALFAGAMEAMLRDGYLSLLEVGPHPILRRPILEIAGALRHEVVFDAAMARPGGTG